ncbi:hypothetical protein FRC11_014653, partial [Ceratobasidium sp. 423]
LFRDEVEQFMGYCYERMREVEENPHSPQRLTSPYHSTYENEGHAPKGVTDAYKAPVPLSYHVPRSGTVPPPEPILEEESAPEGIANTETYAASLGLWPIPGTYVEAPELIQAPQLEQVPTTVAGSFEQITDQILGNTGSHVVPSPSLKDSESSPVPVTRKRNPPLPPEVYQSSSPEERIDLDIHPYSPITRAAPIPTFTPARPTVSQLETSVGMTPGLASALQEHDRSQGASDDFTPVMSMNLMT